MSVSQECITKNCPTKAIAKGYCSKHYKRFYYPKIKNTLREYTPRTGLVRDNLSDWYVYSSIRYRCENKNCKSYKNYGGRGIKMQHSWKGNFGAFLSYIKELPHYKDNGYTLDRIDNDKGYEEGNLRYANRSLQTYNQRLSERNKSGFKGVSKKPNGKYIARLGYKGKKINLGVFNTPEEAHAVVNLKRQEIIKDIIKLDRI